MVKDYMMIDNQRVEMGEEKNLLDLIRKAGMEMPTFCYYSELSVFGACRMCMVEDEWGGIIASCSTPPKKGMQIKTNTPKLQKHRKMILELLLSNHCRDCTTCEKNTKCRLQELALRFGIKRVRFENNNHFHEVDDSSPAIVRDPGKCILCGDCVRMCSEIQNVGAIDFAFRGSNMEVRPAFDLPLDKTNCVHCGQCSAVCPTGAIVVRNDTEKFWEYINDPGKRVVVQVAPAVRVALGEEFDIPFGENVMGKIVAALRRMGFDEVYDTSLGADLTVMEESRELLKKLEKGETLPLFTSCCPAWVRYAEQNHEELLGQISTFRSPQQMFGAVIKEHYRSTKDVDPRETVVLGLMPCTAKKFEAGREEFMTQGVADVDHVMTTQEFAHMLKEAGIVFSEVEPEATDMPFGLASGSGVLFGVTGGVSEAVARRLAQDKSPGALHDIAFAGVRGMEGMKEAEFFVGDRLVRMAIVSGLSNAEALIEKVCSGAAQYDFVEVMACPGGCVAGAGQPFALRQGQEKRAKGIYTADKLAQIKRSEENPLIMALYGGVLKNKVKSLLHVHYEKGRI
ncbi:MAG: [FeFe] hydrogenase, group A [Christensenellales bacterium]|jgi:NADH-quinone oxidoreductase subunit G